MSTASFFLSCGQPRFVLELPAQEVAERGLTLLHSADWMYMDVDIKQSYMVFYSMSTRFKTMFDIVRELPMSDTCSQRFYLTQFIGHDNIQRISWTYQHASLQPLVFLEDVKPHMFDVTHVRPLHETFRKANDAKKPTCSIKVKTRPLCLICHRQRNKHTSAELRNCLQMKKSAF